MAGKLTYTLLHSGADRGAQAMANGGVLKYVVVRQGAGNEGIRLKADG